MHSSLVSSPPALTSPRSDDMGPPPPPLDEDDLPPSSPTWSMAAVRHPVRRPGLASGAWPSPSAPLSGAKTPYPHSRRTTPIDPAALLDGPTETEWALPPQPPGAAAQGTAFGADAMAAAARQREAAFAHLGGGDGVATRDVEAFIASYLAANGHEAARRLFQRRRPVAEQRLASGAARRRAENGAPPAEGGVRARRGGAVPSPTYVYSATDLFLFAADTVRREQLLDDTIPWRQINCQSRDFRLAPLEDHKQYVEQHETRRRGGALGGTSSTATVMGNANGGATAAVGGSLDLLVEVLILVETDTPFVAGMPIFNYTNVFILLSSLFVLPEVLVVHLIRLFRLIREQHVFMESSRCAFLQRRVVQFIIAYCRYHEADMTLSLLHRLRRFVGGFGSIMSSDGSSTGAVGGRLQELATFTEDLIRRLDAPFSCRRPLGTIKLPSNHTDALPSTALPSPLPFSPLQQSQGSVMSVEFASVSVEVLAEQLCLVTFRLFSDIHIRELLNNAWCDELTRLSVPFHLTRFIDYVSHVQRWVAACIVSPSQWSRCAASLRHGVHLCRLLYDRQNYEVAAAVLAGLQHPAVTELERRRRQQEQQQTHSPMLRAEEEKELAALQDLMDPFASHESPSSLCAVSSRATGDMEAPMIPLLAPVLGVLFRIEESKGKTVAIRQGDGVPIVNWSKMIALGKTIFLWLRCQNIPYDYPVDFDLQHYLLKLPGHQYTDTTLQKLAKQVKLEN